jgi:hypothetical protein
MKSTNSAQRIFGKYVGEREFSVKKELQAAEEFNTAIGNRMSYRSFSQTQLLVLA